MKEGTMKQAWLMGKGGPWEIREVPIPKPGPGQLLIKMKASSICNQTDLNTIRALHPPEDLQLTFMLPHHLRIWDNRIPDALSDVYPARPHRRKPFPTIMGHEGMGEVVEVGPYIKKEETLLAANIDFKPGDRVASFNTRAAFGEYVLLDRNETIKVPDSVSNEEASLLEPGIVVYSVVENVVSITDTVCILGQGALGLIATQLARVRGASRIIVSEPIAMKRKLAKKFGADITIDPSTTNVVHEIEKLTDGKGVNAIIEAAGVPGTIRVLPYIAGVGAMIGQIGACCVPVMVDWSYIHFKAMQVVSVMSQANWVNFMKTSMGLLASGKLNVKPMITHRYKLEDIDKAFKDVESGMVIKGMFIFE